jgi:hypothetical protein
MKRKLSKTYHVVQNRGTIIGHRNITIGADKHLIHALRTEGCLHGIGHCLGGHYV